jgi:hypothetical protein
MSNIYDGTLKEMLGLPNKIDCEKVRWLLNIPTWQERIELLEDKEKNK